MGTAHLQEAARAAPLLHVDDGQQLHENPDVFGTGEVGGKLALGRELPSTRLRTKSF